MDEPPTPPFGTPQLPAVRPPGPAVRPPAPPGREPVRPHGRETDRGGAPTPPEEPGKGSSRWRWRPRTVRGAVGLALVAAALLLWPFAGWFWVPWLAGLVVLVLVAVLRLDRLLQGWSWHVGALAVVVGLMLKTSPWDWALAGSIGVLLAGLAQLPWWRLAAVGAVLCVVAGIGWGVERHREAQEVAAEQAQAQERSQELNQLSRPGRALPVLLRSIGRGDAGPVCSGVLSDEARASFIAAVRAADCPSAVKAMAAEVVDPAAYGLGRAPSTSAQDVLTVDACHITWAGGAAVGPQLGVLTVGRRAAETTYVVTSFKACTG